MNFEISIDYEHMDNPTLKDLRQCKVFITCNNGFEFTIPLTKDNVELILEKKPIIIDDEKFYINIDTQKDWEIAEFKYKMMNAK